MIKICFLLSAFLLSFANGRFWSPWASCLEGDSTATFTCYRKKERECTIANKTVKGIKCAFNLGVYEVQISDKCASEYTFDLPSWTLAQVVLI